MGCRLRLVLAALLDLATLFVCRRTDDILPISTHRYDSHALVSVGFTGWIHWLAAKKLKNAKVVAICGRDAKKRGGDFPFLFAGLLA